MGERMKFRNGREMYDYLKHKDLYSPSLKMYAFGYNDCGSIAYYVINEEEAKELAGKAKHHKNYWSAFLGWGGYICDIGDNYEELYKKGLEYEPSYDNEAYWFCKEHFYADWYDTDDYANYVLNK